MKERSEKGLEQFIRQNREEFDRYEVPVGLWEKIADQLEEEEEPDRKKPKVIKIPTRNLWRVAAAVLLIVGIYGVIRLNDSTTSPESAEAVALQKINPELAEAEVYYTRMIEQKKEEIAHLASQESNLDEEFYQDLEELDSMYIGLKEELYQMPTQERVMEAMIQNLQTRIEILNRQLEILQKIKNLKNGQKNEELNI